MRNIASWTLGLGLAILANAAQADTFQPERLPVREMLKAMKDVEAVETSLPILQGQPSNNAAGNPAQVVAEGYANQEISVEWDPFALPSAMKSWMLFNLKDETWGNIRENKNEKGQPLL